MRVQYFSRYILNSEMSHLEKVLWFSVIKRYCFRDFTSFSVIADANKVALESYLIIHVLVKAEGRFCNAEIQKLVLIIIIIFFLNNRIP